jgi:hypothetical protein
MRSGLARGDAGHVRRTGSHPDVGERLEVRRRHERGYNRSSEVVGGFSRSQPLVPAWWKAEYERKDLLALKRSELSLYYRCRLPQLRQQGKELVGTCPFCECGGEIHVSLEYGTFEIHGGCRQQASVYGMEMRLFGVKFPEAQERILALLTSTAGGPSVHVVSVRFRIRSCGPLTSVA